MECSQHQVSTTDGVRISFDLYHEAGRKVVIVICPGFFQSKETLTFQRLASTLSSGCDVLAMDFRGHGRSKGLYTFSAKEGEDLKAVLRWTRERYARIGIIGFSLGGAIAINALSSHPEQVVSLIAVSAPSIFEEIEFKWWTSEAMRTGVRGLEPGSGCRPGNLFLKKAQPIDHVKKLAPVPVFFIHGTRDVIVGVEHSRRLYTAALEPKRLEIIEGGSHAEALFRDDPQRLINLVNGWYAKTLIPASGFSNISSCES